MTGRSGRSPRIGWRPGHTPKWMSVPPPKLKFAIPPRTNNPFHFLEQYDSPILSPVSQDLSTNSSLDDSSHGKRSKISSPRIPTKLTKSHDKKRQKSLVNKNFIPPEKSKKLTKNVDPATQFTFAQSSFNLSSISKNGILPDKPTKNVSQDTFSFHSFFKKRRASNKKDMFDKVSSTKKVNSFSQKKLLELAANTSIMTTHSRPIGSSLTLKADESLTRALEQSFLHEYIRGFAFLARLLHNNEKHPALLSIKVPVDGEKIVLDADLVHNLKTHLSVFYNNERDLVSVSLLSTFSFQEILTQAFEADRKLRDYHRSFDLVHGTTSTHSLSDVERNPNYSTYTFKADEKIFSAVEQSFLHHYVRGSVPLSRLKRLDSAPALLPLTIPVEDEDILLTDDVIHNLKLHLLAYHHNNNDTTSLDSVPTLSHENILTQAINANKVLQDNDTTSYESPHTLLDVPESQTVQANSSATSKNNLTQDIDMANTPDPILTPEDDVPSQNIRSFTSSFTHTPSSNAKGISSPPTPEDDDGLKIKLNKKSILTCRFRVRMTNEFSNVPHLVRVVVNEMRKADPALSILPFSDPISDQNVLDHENRIPDDKDSMKTWVTNVYTYRGNVNFSMKFAVFQTTRTITDKLFPWMRAHFSFVKVDEISSEKVTTLGFFLHMHPDFHHRDEFKSYCVQHIAENATPLNDNISVYPRYVYSGSGIHKITTRVCVIESAAHDAAAILKGLTTPFSNHYENIVFVPFTKLDESYSDTLQSIMQQQNKYLKETRKLTLFGLKHIDDSVLTIDGDMVTPRQWLVQTQYKSNHIIKAVEATNMDAVNLLYDKEHDLSVNQVVSNIENILASQFSHEVISAIYEKPSKTALRSRVVVTESQRAYMDVLKRRFLNPQDSSEQHSEPPTKNRRTLTYGAIVKGARDSNYPADSSPKAHDDRLTFLESKLQSLQNKVDQADKSPDQYIQLRNDHDQLQTQCSTFLSSQPDDISDLVKTTVDALGRSLRSELTTHLEQKTTDVATKAAQAVLEASRITKEKDEAALIEKFKVMLLQVGVQSTVPSAVQNGDGKH